MPGDPSGPRAWDIEPLTEMVNINADNTAALAADPTTFAAYREDEALHACWGMLRTMVCLTPELLSKYAGVPFASPFGSSLVLGSSRRVL